MTKEKTVPKWFETGDGRFWYEGQPVYFTPRKGVDAGRNIHGNVKWLETSLVEEENPWLVIDTGDHLVTVNPEIVSENN